jgi:hypothetical protein
MKPQDIYNSPVDENAKSRVPIGGDWANGPIVIDGEPLEIFTIYRFLDHFHEVDTWELGDRIDGEGILSVKIHVDICHDGRRTCCVASAWFNGKPFAVLRRGGRDDDEYRERLITNEALFREAICYLSRLSVDNVSIDADDRAFADDEIEDLDTWYCCDIRKKLLGDNS